jgi:hypothetical protein
MYYYFQALEGSANHYRLANNLRQGSLPEQN